MSPERTGRQPSKGKIVANINASQGLETTGTTTFLNLCVKAFSMTELIICLGDEKSDGYIEKLIQAEEWESVILVFDDKSRAFSSAKNVKMVYVDSEKKLVEMVKILSMEFSRQTKGIEVAVNIVAGKGKTSMAVIAALISAGKGIRLVAWSKEGLVVF